MKRKNELKEPGAAKLHSKQVLRQHGDASLCKAALDLYERHVPFMRAGHAYLGARWSER